MGIRILIVDDDASFLGLAAELLAERGFDVLGKATDAAQALAATIRECPDGIVLDINLPGRDGFATAAALSAACPSARIVLTSADVRHVPPSPPGMFRRRVRAEGGTRHDRPG